MLGVCKGEEDEDEGQDSNDADEVVERRVDPRDKIDLGTGQPGQGQMSRGSLEDESEEEDIQLQGRGPLTRYIFLRVCIERG